MVDTRHTIYWQNKGCNFSSLVYFGARMREFARACAWASVGGNTFPATYRYFKNTI